MGCRAPRRLRVATAMLVGALLTAGWAGTAAAFRLQFAPARTRSLEEPSSLALGRVLGHDRRRDVVVTNRGHLFAFRRRADGRLARPVSYRLRSEIAAWPGGVAAGDLDGDRRADVAVAVDEGVNVFYQRRGALRRPVLVRLDPPDPYFRAYNVEQVEIADLDRDGRRDIVLNTFMSGILVLWNTRSGFLLADPIPTADPSDERLFDVAVGDVTGDGRPDVVVPDGSSPPGQVDVLETRPRRRFSLRTYPDPPADCGAVGPVAIGDVTGDGRNDVVGGNECPRGIDVFAQRADGSLAPARWTQSRPQGMGAVRVHDMNGDGRADIVLAHGGADWDTISVVGVFLQRRGGTLSRERLFFFPYTSFYQPSGLAVGDLNGDHRPDIALADSGWGLVWRAHRVCPECRAQHEPP